MTSLHTAIGPVPTQTVLGDAELKHRPVVGLDLSLTAAGVCVIDGGVPNTFTVKSTADPEKTVLSLIARCNAIVDGIAARIVAVADDALFVVEGLSMHSKSSSLDRIFASWYLILGELHHRYGQEAAVVAPTQRAKYASGKGNASKDTVLLAVAARYPSVGVTDNNQADALVLAAMGARHLGHPVEESLPVVNLSAMDAVRWLA